MGDLKKESRNMDLFNVMKDAVSAANLKKVSNYYYEEHICEKSGNNIRIHLDYMLSSETDDEMLRFGICKQCSTCFYHKDFKQSGF